MPPVTSRQFGQLAMQLHTPDEGFSIHTQTGEAPSSGIMVSRKGTEKAIEPPGAVTGQHLQSFAAEHAEALSSRNKFMGGWHDPREHQVDLDVSQRYPADQRAHATKQMLRHDQFAAYDVDQGRSVPNFLKTGTKGTHMEFMGEKPDTELYGQVQEALKPGRAPMPPFVAQHLRRRRTRP